MYNINDGAILEVSVRSLYQTQRLLTVRHFKLIAPTPVDGPTFINAIDAPMQSNFANGWIGKLIDLYSDAVINEEVVYQWIAPNRFARIVKVPTAPNGGRAGAEAPPNVAAFFQETSDVAGRHGHGGVHAGGLLVQDLNGGFVDPAYRALTAGFIASLSHVYDDLGGHSVFPVIFNRAAPSLSVPITGANLKDTVRTMHRRTVGLGE
jgi:hypothetical protein